MTQELREIAHEDPDAMIRMANKAGGRIEKRLKRLLREEGFGEII